MLNKARGKADFCHPRVQRGAVFESGCVSVFHCHRNQRKADSFLNALFFSKSRVAETVPDGIHPLHGVCSAFVYPVPCLCFQRDFFWKSLFRQKHGNREPDSRNPFPAGRKSAAFAAGGVSPRSRSRTCKAVSQIRCSTMSGDWLPAFVRTRWGTPGSDHLVTTGTPTARSGAVTDI